MTQQSQTTNDRVGSASKEVSEDLLRDSLKRCSAKTLDAAIDFARTGDVSNVPVVVMGIVERFLDPDVADKLESGDDSIRFMEDLGLDSLTMIEAIMLVEESLGISIKNEELISLRSIGDLKAFINAKISGEDDPALADEFYPLEQVAAIMPQQEPFLFVSEAALQERSASGKYSISGQEHFLEGHFKGNPVFPASIMLEALGQLAVFHLIKKRPSEVEDSEIDGSSIYFTGADGVRCHRICKPGDTLDLSVALKKVHAPLAVFSGQISVNGEKAVVAEEITLAFAPSNYSVNGSNGNPA